MISTSPRGGRPLVEGAVALRVGDLRSRWGWLRRLDLDAPDGSTVKLALDVGEADTFAWLLVEHWPAGARWESARYHVSLCSAPQPFGGRRWRFLCPRGFGSCGALYLPAGADRFASRRAHGLAFTSQRQRAPARAAARAARIRADLGGDGSARPKGMWRSTFDRRVAELVRLDDVGTA